jgi:uncharacterized membrane protein YhaH (DUF805 family)
MYSRNRPDRDDRNSFGWRINRADFWAGTLLYVLTTFGLMRFAGIGGWGLVIGSSLFLTSGRLKDFGRSSWWVVLLPVGFIASVFMLRGHALLLGLDISLIALSTLIFFVYVGFTPGDGGPNRFGPPPVGFIQAMRSRRRVKPGRQTSTIA